MQQKNRLIVIFFIFCILWLWPVMDPLYICISQFIWDLVIFL